FAPGVDDLGRGGGFYVGVRSYPNDAIARDDNACSRGNTQIARVEQARVTNYEIAYWFPREAPRHLLGPGRICFFLGGLQFLDRAFRSIWHNREPTRN